jgi:hypothetical protein
MIAVRQAITLHRNPVILVSWHNPAGPGYETCMDGQNESPGESRPEPSAVGKSGPGQAVAQDVAEALGAGRFFRLVDGKGHELAIGRLAGCLTGGHS